MGRWKTKFLSYTGRMQLLKWGIYKKLIFWLEACKIFDTILIEVQSIIYRFLWDKSKAIGWELVGRLFEEGGLGSRNKGSL